MKSKPIHKRFLAYLPALVITTLFACWVSTYMPKGFGWHTVALGCYVLTLLYLGSVIERHNPGRTEHPHACQCGGKCHQQGPLEPPPTITG